MNVKKTGDRPLFSVIIPAYNAASYLAKGVQSVLEQTFRDWELLLVDDGSADETYALCCRFAEQDGRIRAFHKENGGHTSARNLGLVNSRGCYIVFLDSDDYLDLDVLERGCAEIMDGAPEVIVYGILHHAPGGVKRVENTVHDGRYATAEDDILSKLLMGVNGEFAVPKTLNGKIFKREIILPCQQSLPQEILLGEDGAAFVHAVLTAKRISVISGTDYHLMVREASVSHSGDPLSMQRHIRLLEYYRQTIVPQSDALAAQFERFMVLELYTALQVMLRAGCSNGWLRTELDKAMEDGFIREGVDAARFGSAGWKLQIKRWLIRHKMFGIIRLLDGLKGRFGCGKYQM